MLTVYPDRLRRDLAVAIANAPFGSKRVAGYAALTPAFPIGSVFRLVRNDVTVFQFTALDRPGPASADGNGGLLLPRVYGTPTILTNADINTGTWRWTLTSGDNYLSGAVGPSTAAYILSGSLATTKGLTIGSFLATLPNSLDGATGTVVPGPTPAPPPPAPPPGTGATGPLLDRWVTSMTMPDQGSSVRYSSAAWANQPGQNHLGSAAGLTFITQQGGGDIMTFGNGLDGLTCWNWADVSAGHDRANSELQLRSNEAWVLRADNVWERMWSSPMGTGFAWTSDNTLTGVGTTDRTSVGSGVRAFTQDLHFRAHEIWPVGFIPVVNGPLMRQARCWHVRSLVRVARFSSAIADGRAAARFRFKVGFDVFNTSHPHYPQRGDNPGITNQFRRPEQGTMPGYAMDGGMCSWHVVPFDPGNPDAWYSIAVTSFTPAFYTAAGLHPAVASALGRGVWTPNPAGLAPYAISQSAFRGNAPPLPV